MDDIILIGVDGGASKVLAHSVEIGTDPLRFFPVKPIIEVSYNKQEKYSSKFKPVNLAQQLKDLKQGSVVPTKDEVEQGEAIIMAFKKTLTTILSIQNPGKKKIIIGVGMPGLKTPRKRGISAMANGPRMPQFLTTLEKMLVEDGFDNIEKIHALGSDADYCGYGERYGDQGSIRECKNAYYLGIGSGVADAILIDGENIPFDDIQTWIPKAWEMTYDETHSFENIISAKGIQQLYADKTDQTTEEIEAQEIYPWQIYEKAKDGDTIAIEVTELVAEGLASLIYQRITALGVGDASVSLISNNHEIVDQHPHVGKTFDKFVIGQRLGDIWGNLDFYPLLRNRVNILMSRKLIDGELPTRIRSAYLSGNNRFKEELIVHSELRHAPALGAAVDAYLNWTK
jgi:predicted NBD/HSP70 family sugar kinase